MRQLLAIDPDKLKIDDRSLSELVNHSLLYAPIINFYNLTIFKQTLETLLKQSVF